MKKEDIIATIEQLSKERSELILRLSALEDQIADFRGDLDILKLKHPHTNTSD